MPQCDSHRWDGRGGTAGTPAEVRVVVARHTLRNKGPTQPDLQENRGSRTLPRRSTFQPCNNPKDLTPTEKLGNVRRGKNRRMPAPHSRRLHRNPPQAPRTTHQNTLPVRHTIRPRARSRRNPGMSRTTAATRNSCTSSQRAHSCSQTPHTSGGKTWRKP